MRLDFSNKWIRNLLRVVLFIVSVVFVYECIPHQTHFERQFVLGKPWPYELLTAEFDFPIYKSNDELRVEQDSAMRHFVPYFDINYTVADSTIALFNQNEATLSVTQKERIAEQLRDIYATGVMSASVREQLTDYGISQVALIDKSLVVNKVDFANVYTPRSAYDHLAQQKLVSDDIWHKINLNQYIIENLAYDQNKSDLAKQELLRTISLTSGMVQSGERIIDRGEIVNLRTYKILNSLKLVSDESQDNGRQRYWVVIGHLLFIAGLFLLFFLYLHLFRPRIYNSNHDILFVMFMVVAMVALAALTVTFTSVSIYIVPFALLPIIIRTFYDSRTALFAHIITVLMSSLIVDLPFDFLLMQITAGMTVVSSLKEMSQRSQLVRTALLVLLSYSFIYLSIRLIQDGSFNNVDWWIFGVFAVNSLLQLIAYALIFIFEKIFGFLSNMTLLELSNVNTKLLLEFSEKAPGTFQHALQVANLATEAATRVRVNSLLVRTGALYHDIGKMVNPLYFVENQNGEVNPLNDMQPEDAAQIIISHVTDGAKIADKYHLPNKIKAFILTHHADGKVTYFYNTQKNLHPDEEIDDAKFTYPGPKPGSKETTIVMMADAIEAASRTLKNYEEKTIDDFVERIINGQIASGAFQNSPITFRDVEMIKAVFKEKLKSIYHSRISYPKLERNKKK